MSPKAQRDRLPGALILTTQSLFLVHLSYPSNSDGEIRTLTDRDLNPVPLPFGLRRLLLFALRRLFYFVGGPLDFLKWVHSPPRVRLDCPLESRFLRIGLNLVG